MKTKKQVTIRRLHTLCLALTCGVILNPHNLAAELDVIGNQLSLRAWRPGEPLPEQPQLSAQADTVSGPELEISRSPEAGQAEGVLRWLGSNDQHVVLAADSAFGPWALLAQPILEGDGLNWTQIAMGEAAQFYRLVQGHRFDDAFTGGLKPGWETNYHGQPGWPSFVTVASENDRLRVTVAPQPNSMNYQGSIPFVRLMRPEVVAEDVFMSMDILAWDHSKSPTCALITGIRADGLFGVCLFGFSPHASSDPSRAVLWSFTSQGLIGGTPFAIDPARSYRLVVAAVGGLFTIQLFDLQNPSVPDLVSTHSTFDDSLLNHPAGLYFGDANSGPEGGFDITVDNVVFLGTRGL